MGVERNESRARTQALRNGSRDLGATARIGPSGTQGQRTGVMERPGLILNVDKAKGRRQLDWTTVGCKRCLG